MAGAQLWLPTSPHPFQPQDSGKEGPHEEWWEGLERAALERSFRIHRGDGVTGTSRPQGGVGGLE